MSRHRRILSFGGQLLPYIAGSLTFALAFYPAARWLALVMVTALGLGSWWLRRRAPHDPYAVLRSLGGATVAVLGVWRTGVDSVALLAYAAAMGLIMVDAPLRARIQVHGATRNLTGVPASRRHLSPGSLHMPGALSLAWLVLAEAVRLPSLVTLAGVLGASILGLIWLRADIADSRRRTVMRLAGRALAERGTRFLVYFSGPEASHYQIRMWLPFLQRTGLPFAILVREAHNLDPLADVGVPVVWANSLNALEEVVAGPVRAVFYVNTEAKNVDGVRFLLPTHVHLNHGDSDKPPSYSPTLGMYDLVFLAGQAAVDRFARHGVVIPPEKLVIVGRPQVEGIAAAEPRPERPSVLYAPTWRGGVADMGFGSLSMGAEVVRALLRLGVRVMFRPHPYSQRDSESVRYIADIDALLAGADHWDSQRTAGNTVVECFNASDALVTDISSLASDYLFSGKPFAVVDTGVTDGDLAAVFPLVRAAYVLPERGDPAPQLLRMLSDDPLAAERRSLKAYYLGGFPDATYADHFVAAARDAAGGTPSGGPGSG